MALKKQGYIKGSVAHRRTEADYMGTMLDAVTLEDWRAVVEAAVRAAKAGEAGARSWLAQYLVGKAGTTAPAPLTVVAHQLSGHDRLVEVLAQPHIDRELFPSLIGDSSFSEAIKARIAAELRALEESQSGESDSIANHDETKP